MILIAPVNQEDIAAICEMERRFFSPPYSQSALEHEKTHPDAVFLAAREEERLVGYVLLRCLGDEGELHRIAVLPEWRGRGIALGVIIAFGLLGQVAWIALVWRLVPPSGWPP